jgi:hypothetical protein
MILDENKPKLINTEKQLFQKQNKFDNHAIDF